MALAASEIIVRSLVRSELSDLASKAIITFAFEDQVKIKLKYREKYPSSERRAVLRMLLFWYSHQNVTLVAVVLSTGERVGMASWAATGPNSVAQKWKNHNASWSNSLELNLLEMERSFAKRFDSAHADRVTIDTESRNREGTLTHSKDANHIELKSLFVAHDWQGKGVGKLLVEWGLNGARKEWLPVAVDSSAVGKTFYEKFGFKVIYWVNLDEAGSLSAAGLL